jgi:hypothetical protein
MLENENSPPARYHGLNLEPKDVEEELLESVMKWLRNEDIQPC